MLVAQRFPSPLVQGQNIYQFHRADQSAAHYCGQVEAVGYASLPFNCLAGMDGEAAAVVRLPSAGFDGSTLLEDQLSPRLTDTDCFHAVWPFCPME
jgi:hypothetical protein